MLKKLIHTLAEEIGSNNVPEQEEERRPLKHTAVTMKVLGSEKEVKVGWLLSRIIDGLIEIPAPQVKPTYEELKNEDFDADSYVRRSQAALEKSVLDAEKKIDGCIIPFIAAEDHSADSIILPYVNASSYRTGLHARCISAFGAPLNDDALNSIAKTCAYLSTPIYAEQSFRKTVMVIPNEWLLHTAMMDGVGYVRAKGETLVEHPRCGAITDSDVLQVRGLVKVPIDNDNFIYLYKGTIAPIHITQMAGVFKREHLEKVDEALNLGYIIATGDTLKRVPTNIFPDAQFFIHDSAMADQWTNLRSLSLQAAMKLCWQDISGLEGKLFQKVLEYCGALDNDRSLVEDVAGKISTLDENEDLPIAELTAALDQVLIGGLAPYDRINLSALLVKIMTTKRIKQVAEIKEKGMRLYVVANNDVPRGCVRIGKSNFWRMKAAWKSVMAVVARAPYTTTSVNACRVICGKHDNPTVEINPLDAGMFSADFDGDKMTLTEYHSGTSFVSLGQIIDDMPLPVSVSKASLAKYCPLIPTQYGTQNETTAILYALSVGNRVDVGDSLVLGLITKLEDHGMSPLNARLCSYSVERGLFESLIDCKKHVDSGSKIPNIAAISLLQMRERLFAPSIYKLLSGKLDFDGVSVADIPKAIREELEDSPLTRNPILEAVRGYLLDFLPERCAYTFNRVNCDKAKALIREILYEYPDIVKELQFSVKDNGKAMTIENPILDSYLTLCKEKRFDEAAKYMDEIISPWIKVYTIDKSDRATAVWFILAAFVVKNRAAAGHMRWGFILRHVPAIILRTAVEISYTQTEPIDHELYTEYRKKDISTLTILKTA